MKIRLLALAVFGFAPNLLNAIPTNIGGFFINPANSRLEDFANQQALWKAEVPLKGDWTMWNDRSVTDSSIEVQRLAMRAIVFGREASLVTVQKQHDRPLRFVIRYAQEDEKRDLKLVRETLIRNAALWADQDAPESGDAMPKIKHEHLVIEFAKPKEDHFDIVLSPAST